MAAIPDFRSGFSSKNEVKSDQTGSFLITAHDLSLLTELKPLLDQHTEAILEACRRHLVNFLDDPETADRLKTLQRSYLEQLVSGQSGLQRTNLLHEQIDLAPHFAMESYATILSQIIPLIVVKFNALPTERQAILSALIKVLFIDMASATEAHTEEITGKQALRIHTLRERLKQQEVRLKDSKARFRSIFENVSIPLITYDHSGKIMRWNQPFEDLLDRPEEHIAGRNFFEILTEKGSQNRIQSMVNTIFQGEELTEIHWKIKTPSGIRRNLSVSTFPVFAADGSVAFGIAMFMDMTEKIEMEQALLHTDKMVAMGTLASGLAHEIGTPMNVILGRAESLLRQTKEEKTAKGLMIIIEQIDRMTHLINRLLAFARKTPIERKKIALNLLIHKSLEIVEQRASTKDIPISLDLEETLYPIWGEDDQILQVLVNLLMNAIDASPRGGNISIKTSSISIKERYTRRTSDESKKKQMAQILVKDKGRGIDAAYLDKIFDPFFTTKPVGKGTGLGLAVASGIIRDHGGQIEVASSREGSTFCIRLPAEKPQS